MANFSGNVHGGTILKLLDQVAYACASRYAGTYVVTLSVDQVTFRQPIHVGELVTFLASVNFTGKSSMEIGIKVVTENIRTQVVRHTQSCFFTMVAVDDEHKPTAVPPLSPSTPVTPDMANFSGNVHGGTILKLLDQVAYACASRYAGHAMCVVGYDDKKYGAMEFMKNTGGVPYNNFPYSDQDCSRQPNRSMQQEAAQFRMRGFNRLSLGDRNDAVDLRAIRENLAQGAPVVIGMMVGQSFMQPMMGKDIWVPAPGDQQMMGFGGHAMCVVGYDDKKYGAMEFMKNTGGVPYNNFPYLIRCLAGEFDRVRGANDSDVLAAPPVHTLADGHLIEALGHDAVLLHEPAVLEHQDRVVVGDCREEQALGIGRRARHDDLEARDAHQQTLDGLRMLGSGSPAPAGSQPHTDHWHGRLPVVIRCLAGEFDRVRGANDSDVLAAPPVHTLADGHPDDMYGQDVGVAIVLKDSQKLEPADLKSWMAERVAKFKLPKKIFFTDVMPKTATGKIQRRMVAEAMLKQEGPKAKL